LFNRRQNVLTSTEEVYGGLLKHYDPKG